MAPSRTRSIRYLRSALVCSPLLLTHRKDNTDLKILAYPLDDCGRPRIGATHRGRFILVYPGFLETADYRTGQKLSAISRIIGVRRGRIGDTDYSFPLLESYKIYPWLDRQTSDPYARPGVNGVNIGIGGGNGDVFGEIGIVF